MAVLALLDWKPNPLTALPHLTVVSFNAASDGPAIGYQIVYELQSVHLQFQMPAAGVLLPKEEADTSSPVPQPIARAATRIVDRVDVVAATPPKPITDLITRGLIVERVAGGSPGIVFLNVTVREIDAAGNAQFPMSVLVSTALAFGV